MKTAFKITSYLEGLSYLGLLFIGVPMKYIMGNDKLVKMLGMPHGVLFVAYIILAIYVFTLGNPFKWTRKTFFIVLAASIIPFGTFYIDKKYC